MNLSATEIVVFPKYPMIVVIYSILSLIVNRNRRHTFDVMGQNW